MSSAADRLDFVEVEIGDLPLYNQDLDGKDPPAEWSRFRQEMKAVDGLLFGCPEYNRGITGVLKNAIDVGSRPYGRSVYTKKPAAAFSGSTGMTGGFGANHALRQSCVFLDMPIMQQPEAYWGLLSDEKVGLDGTVHDETVQKLVVKFAAAFANWVDLIRAGCAKIAEDPAHQ
jgi:chromate reductase, NAD(P)H dehydrogenase (quinone)